MDDYKIYLTEGSKLEYFKVDDKNPKATALNRAADLIKAGGVIVYPTDTLYGFGVNVMNPLAMEKLYELKGREAHKPISLLINTKSQAEAIIGRLNPEESRIYNQRIIYRWCPRKCRTVQLLRVKSRVDRSHQKSGERSRRPKC